MYNWLWLSLLLLFLGWWFTRRGQQAYRASGLPMGEVVYQDTGAWQKVEKPLLNHQYGLIGKPDYLVQVREQGRTFTIPVEVKSGKRPATPHGGHILQLGAYCLLVEDVYQRTPPYGLLHYADATLRIPFTTELRQQVNTAAEAIRRDQRANDVPRNHQQANRCRACGYQQGCGEQRLDTNKQ
ncbi:MAG: CRISPR-associated protein Cas4 [Caldilineaceae bacterium]|nr:CRISPR-associated protein Cas4 [Caldilineaceae bacterium]